MKRILMAAIVMVRPEDAEDEACRKENEEKAKELVENRENDEKIVKVAPGVENVASTSKKDIIVKEAIGGDFAPTVEIEEVEDEKDESQAIQKHRKDFYDKENHPRVVGSFLQIGCKDE